MEKVYKHPWLILAVLALITGFFAFQLPRVELDNNNIRFVPADDPARITSSYIDDTFGSSIFILVGLERKYGTVLDGPFLNRVRDYVAQIEQISMVGTVYSIVNADYVYGDGESVIAEPLLPDDFTGTTEEIAELRRRLFSWDLYEDALISDDLSATQILVPLNLTEENYGSSELAREYMEVRSIAHSSFEGMADVYVTGIPIIASTINEAVAQDMRLMIPLVILVVIVIVFIPFRRMGATILSLVSVLIAVIWSMGAMPLFDIKLSVISTVLPVILIAMGSSYGLHVVIHYIEDRGLGTMTDQEHHDMVMALVRRTGKPIFLAALTTFASFVSFCFTRVVPIREFGFFASFGVLVSFLITETLVPAILLIRGPKPLREFHPAHGNSTLIPGRDDSIRNKIAHSFCVVVSHRGLVLCVVVLIAVLSVYGASKIIIDNVLIEYFKLETDIHRSDIFIREKFGGSKILSVVVEAEQPEILLHPDSLAALDRLGTYLEQRVPEVGNVMGFTDLIKRVNQVQNSGVSPGSLIAAPTQGTLSFWDFDSEEAAGAEQDYDGYTAEDAEPWGWTPGAPEWDGDRVYSIAEIAGLLDRSSKAGLNRSIGAAELVREFERLVNYEGYAYYEIPQDPARYGKATKEELTDLIFSYLLLLSGDISDYTNDPLEPTSIKLTVQLKTTGQADTDRGVQEIRRFVEANFPENLNVIVGGTAIVEGTTNVLVVQSQLISVIISIIAMFVIMAVSYRSLAAGGIAIIPLSILILANFAAMGFLKIKLNLATAMISSVSIGVGIDYTIHFIEAYKREYHLSGGLGDFLRRAYYVSGTAILVDTLSVGLGFAVLWFSNFIVLRDFGLLVCLAMMISALSGLIIVPALLGVLKPKFIDQ